MSPPPAVALDPVDNQCPPYPHTPCRSWGAGCEGDSWDRQEAAVNDFDLVLPAEVDIREVGMRDGLQLEAPVPLGAKLEMLEALVATGVRRIEATSFVSPKAVPALADADQVAAELSRSGEVHRTAPVAHPRGGSRAVDSGVSTLEYVVSASDGHSRANAGRSTAEAVGAVGEIAALAH